MINENIKKSYWLWYPGDLELYHALKQNFSRVERGMGWPAYWKSSSYHQRIALWRIYDLSERTSFTVTARGTGFVRVIEEITASEDPEAWRTQEISRVLERTESKHRFGDVISCGPGRVTVIIHVGRIEALPTAYVEGEVISSVNDGSWLADNYGEPAVPAGWNAKYTMPGQDPAVWEYTEKRCLPGRTEEVPGGTLYEWETELTAVLEVKASSERLSDMIIYPGESREEALDTEHCYLRWQPEVSGGNPAVGRTPRCAVRYAFIPGAPVDITAIYQFEDFSRGTHFFCDDPLLNQIWAVAEHTFRLCSGIFFTDGIKRDMWIWAGDAYQSFFVNRYLMADADIERRTLLALRGSDPVTTHINTIVDYSLYWILAAQEHMKSAGDPSFLRQLWPRMCTLMDFCESRLDENGFLIGKERDWVYIDWAELDKEGPVAGEQMLLTAAWEAMAETAEKLASCVREEKTAAGEATQNEKSEPEAELQNVRREPDAEEYLAAAECYRKKAAILRDKIQKCFWSESAGAFIDSFASGKNHISRQTNILAMRTKLASKDQTEAIVRNVFNNVEIAPIRTPYFQFYALDALGELGEYGKMLDTIRDYWGGMISRGAVTFWEEFDPSVTGRAQYDMYGDAFGKSLCHAWAASPIYLIGRYLVGLELTEPSADNSEEAPACSFRLTPQLSLFGKLDCTLPVGMDGAKVHLEWDGKKLSAEAFGCAGTLVVEHESLDLSEAVGRVVIQVQ